MKALIINGSGILLDSDLAGIRLLLIELGKEKEMLEHKKKYDEIKQEKPWGLDNLAKLYKGISEKEIDKKSDEIVKEKLRKEAKEIINKLKEKGYLVVNYSSELINILEAQKRELNLDEVYGNILEFENRIATGKLKQKVDRYDRAEKIKKFIEKNNLSEQDVYIIGESVTAIPSAKLGKMIAFNSNSKELNEIAEYKISNLNELLKIIE
jgi:phosphoserine phosphatase